MKIAKRVIAALSVFAFSAGICSVDSGNINVNAAETLSFDYSDVEVNPQNQYYYSDNEEFYIDGIKVKYNNTDVTDQAKFTFYTTPKTTYNGKDFDYTVPFIAEYNNISAEGRLDVKIGMRGDVTLDHKVNVNDLVYIQNDLIDYYRYGKSSIALDSFSVFLGNSDGRQASDSKKPYGTNLLNIGDAFYISSFINGKGNGSMLTNILLNNAIKVDSGSLSVAECTGKAGKIINVPVSQKTKGALGAFEFTCKWESDLIPVGVVSKNSDVYIMSDIKKDSIKVWGYGKADAVANGEIAYLQFQIPNEAIVGEEFGISISTVDYFGTGKNVADMVLTYDGKITVSEISDNPDTEDLPAAISKREDYSYAVKVWDAVVENGATKAELPVMLLGGLKTKKLTLKVTCEAPLSVSKLNNALSSSGNSTEGLIGSYSSDSNLNNVFERLTVAIDKNAAAGTYPVYITVSEMDNIGEEKTVTVINGSVTVKEKLVLYGDVNNDGIVNVRDAAKIAAMLAEGKSASLPEAADYNKDGKRNIRDSAAIAKYLANK